MQDLYSTILFFIVYFLTKDFTQALLILAIAESLPLLQKQRSKQPIPAHLWLKIGVLWLSIGLTWAFASPRFFQYKTTGIYVTLGSVLRFAPKSWKSWLYREVASSTMNEWDFNKLCPSIANAFFMAGLINILAVSTLSLSAWMVFKLILGVALSARIVFLSYPYILSSAIKGPHMHKSSYVQDISATVMNVQPQKID